MFNTFHVDYSFLRWPLDHLFHSSHFKIKNIQRLPSIRSDHFSLYTVLVYEPKHSAKQEGLKAENKDYVQAKTVSNKKDVSKNDVPDLKATPRG